MEGLTVIEFSDQNHTSVIGWLACPQPWARTAALPLDILVQSLPQKRVGIHPSRISILSPSTKIAYIWGSLPRRDTRDQHTLPRL